MDYTDFLEFERKLELIKLEEESKIPKIHIEIEDEEIPVDILLSKGKSFREINEMYKEKPKYLVKVR